MRDANSIDQSISNDEIDLLELWQTIWSRKKLIASAVLLSATLSAGISLLLPNIYRAEVLVSPAVSEDANNSSPMSQLGGLASLAGISIGTTTSVEENLATLKSRTFLWEFIKQENELMTTLYPNDWDEDKKDWKSSDVKEQPSQWDVYRSLSDVISVETDKKSNLVTISVELEDANTASKTANDLVGHLNDYLRKKSIQDSQKNLVYLYEALGKTQVQEVKQSLFALISQEEKKSMLASTQKDFAFKVIDAASAPDKKIKPKRMIIVLLSALMAGFAAVLWVLLQKGIQTRREEGMGI